MKIVLLLKARKSGIAAKPPAKKKKSVSQLHKEKRLNKKGVLVTRYVKNTESKTVNKKKPNTKTALQKQGRPRAARQRMIIENGFKHLATYDLKHSKKNISDPSVKSVGVYKDEHGVHYMDINHEALTSKGSPEHPHDFLISEGFEKRKVRSVSAGSGKKVIRKNAAKKVKSNITKVKAAKKIDASSDKAKQIKQDSEGTETIGTKKDVPNVHNAADLTHPKDLKPGETVWDATKNIAAIPDKDQTPAMKTAFAMAPYLKHANMKTLKMAHDAFMMNPGNDEVKNGIKEIIAHHEKGQESDAPKQKERHPDDWVIESHKDSGASEKPVSKSPKTTNNGSEHSIRSNPKLVKQAIEIAKRKRDDWVVDQFSRLDGKRLSRSDEDDLRYYIEESSKSN